MGKNYIKERVSIRMAGMLLIMLLPFFCGSVMAAPPTITSQPSNSTVCAGGNTSFSVSATGATAYQWQVDQGSGFVNLMNGGVYSGANTPTLTITGATASMNGYVYRAVVTGTPQTRNSNAAALRVETPPSITSDPPNRTICAGGNTTFPVTATGTGLSYQWQVDQGSGFTNISNGGVYSGAASSTLTITGATASMDGYQYRAVVSGSCAPAATSNAATLSVKTVTTTGSQTNVSCNGGSNGSATVSASGGTSPYTYSWMPSGGSSSTATGLSAGNYTVTVTDAAGCTATRTFTITEPPVLTTAGSQTNASCFGSCDGSATVTPSGGTPGYTYSWAPSGGTDSTASNLCAGSYTVTVTDANGCMATQTFTITQPPLLGVSSSVTNNICNGDSAGAIDITVTGGTGPFTFLYSSGATTEDASGLPAGVYVVIVTDTNSCTIADTIIVSEPDQLMITADITNAGCNGDSTGAVDITVSGGTAPYTFSWSNGNTSEDQNGLAAGDYVVIVTDSNQCMLTDTITILQPPLLVLNSLVTNVLCNGDSSGMIDLFVTGGVSPYVFIWSNGDTIQNINNLPAGQFIVTVSDSNGCMVSDTFNITEPAPFIISSVVTNVSCSGDSTGAIDITLSGGTAPFTFSWNMGATTEDLTGLSAGIYTVIIIDSNSCTIIDTFMITQPAALMLSSNVTNVGCNGDSTGAIDITVSGGVMPYSFNWSTGDTTEDASGLPAGDYMITVTDSNGCMITDTITIMQGNSLSISGVVTNVNCSGDSTGAIDITVSGGTMPFSFNWSSGDTTEDVSGLPAGDYMVTVTDSSGCMITDTFTVTQPSGINVSASITHIDCSGDSTGTIDIAVTGGTAPYSFSWNNSTSIEDLSNVPAGIYVITITDSNSCTVMDTFIVVHLDSSLVGINAPDTVCFRSAPITLTATPPGGIFSGGGVNGNTFDPTVSDLGTFVITYTYEDSSACSSGTIVVTDTITVVLCTGMEEASAQATLSLLPNPASDQLMISIDNVTEQQVVIRMYGVDGRLVFEERQQVINSNLNRTVDVSSFGTGIYFVQIIAGEKVFNERIIVR